ncbi:hypothetical protein RB596_009584 [Gaeumannomyces avenae]
MALLARKKGKKLLAQLFELQKDDVDITIPTFISIKFYLKDKPRCNNVQVSPSGDEPSLGIIDRAHLPRFILSQLEAQGISDEHTETVQLYPVLSFILLSLPARPLKKTACFPTLFCWHCCHTRRTRLLFGYLDVDMPPRSYTPAELLALRASRSIEGILTAGRNDPELASIIVAPRERSVNTLGIVGSASTMRPTQETSKDDSSAEREEVVSKRRPEHQFKVVDPAWKLRGRGGSEVVPSIGQQFDKQPTNAPSEIASQHHEGFRRFYKTVMSPTHVRVTAGGRIVPNTRGMLSPTIRRPRDKLAFETRANGSPVKTRTGLPPSADADAAPKAQRATQAHMHLPPPIFAAFSPTFASPVPGSPIQLMAPPMMPINLPYGTYHQASRPSQTSRKPQASPKGPLQELQARKDENEASKQQSGSQQPGTKGPKISPIEQLDLTKPYVVNGQLFYPVPSGNFPAMGVPMVAGIPGFAPLHPQVTGMVPHHLSMNPMFGGLGFPGAPGMIPGMVPGAAPPAVQQQQQQQRDHLQQSQGGSLGFRPPSAPLGPPISSIKPSQITKKQIESLKANLKYHEDQLLFNRHQVDEKEMERMVEMLHGEIRFFETKKERQVAHELQHYPKQESSYESDKADAGSDSQPQRSSSGETSLPDQQKVAAALEDARKLGSLRKRESSRLGSGEISTRTNGLTFGSPDPKCGAGAPELLRSSVLPSGAALAPPFEPRSGRVFEVPRQRSLDDSFASVVLTDEARKSSMERLLSAGAGAWDQFEGTGKPGALTTARPPKGATKKLATNSSMSSQDKPRYELPYLIGTLPPGTDTRTAHDTDYKYPRALTDAETRARYLYWSKAPAEYRVGLPKYDGRNFYRASPPATDSSETAIDASHTGSAQRNPSTSTDSGISFKKPAVTRDQFCPSTPKKQTPRAQPVDTAASANTANMTRKHGNLSMGEVSLNTGARLQGRTSAQSARPADTDVKSIDCLDKRSSEKPGARLLQAMLKRGANRSSEALPGAVTSTNAHGYVPPFGFSTFSMAPPTMGPIVAHPSGSPALSAPSKTSDKNSGIQATPMERQAENRPPLGQSSLEEQFRRMVSGETKQQAQSSIPVDGRTQDAWR